MRIRDLVLPEDDHFYELFSRMGSLISECGELLRDLCGDLSRGPDLCRRIRQIEHEGDEITRQVFEELNLALITPLEPDEISRLATALDDVVDRMDQVAHQLWHYGITQTNEVLIGLADLIFGSALEIQEVISQLKGLRETADIKARVQRIHQHWDSGGEVIAIAIPALFQSGDAIAVIKHKDVYEGLEKVLEKCKDFSHVVHDILISHV
jgi:hypothetical protein